MRVLLYGAQTPTGVGIVQEDDGARDLVALSPCCVEPIAFDWERSTDWKCGKCDRVILEDGMCEYLEADSEATLIVEWIASWTGFAMKDINVEVSIEC